MPVGIKQRDLQNRPVVCESTPTFSRHRWTTSGFILLMIACGEGTINPPTMPSPPPVEEPSPPPEPPTRGPMFTWEDTRGVLIFPGTQATEAQIQQLDARVRARWAGLTPTYNVCSETWGWGPQDAPWPPGPPAASDENLDNLRRFLRTTAELGSQVKLNVFCTMRDNKDWMAREARGYARLIGQIASHYDHVTVSISNEYYHPASALRDGSRLRELRDVLRSAGFRGYIGTDDNIGCSGCDFQYNPALRSLGFIADFHPYRSPNPTRKALRRMANENGGFAVISEPVAYSTTRTGNCCTNSKAEIKRYMCDAEAEGLVWFYHSTDGLGWPVQTPTFEWLPGGPCGN